MMTRRGGQSWLAIWAVCALGCASNHEVSSYPVDLAPGLDGGAPTAATVVDANAGKIDAALPARGDAAAADEPEVCDGVDNDANGIIDDVDVGRDGVCDCLLIATLGHPGGSGQGDVFGTWLDARSDQGAAELGDATLTPQLLAKYQLIVAQDLHNLDAYSPQELDALEAWVRAGGGLLTLIGYAKPDERTNANAILARFGIDYGAMPILPRSGQATVPVRDWVPHPVTEGVTAVGVDNGYPVEGAGSALASEAGYTLLRAAPIGEGHVLAWGDEWITYDSEWQNGGSYQVERLWLNMIKWLTAARVCQVPPIVQ
ncbi:MAG TPA: hypothetical protein VI299_12630 [Polyangiales bacterium]